MVILTRLAFDYEDADSSFGKVLMRIRPGYILATAIIMGFIIGEIGDSIELCYLATSCPNVTDLLVQQNGMVFGHAYWQLFTSIFVTDSFEDALFNALAVIVLEYFLPETFNKTRYFAIFFSAALLGNILTLSEGPSYASAGASGGIFGVFAAAFAYNWAENKRIDLATLVLFIVLFFGSSFFIVQDVDWIAHLGGSIAGFISAPLLFSSLKRSESSLGLSSKSARSSQLVLALIVVFMVVGSIFQFVLFLITA